jgi:hypothetical protein
MYQECLEQVRFLNFQWYLDATLSIILFYMRGSQVCQLPYLLLKLCEYFSYIVSLRVSGDNDANDTRFADQKLQLGGVYTLIVQENNNATVSKSSFSSKSTL